MAATFHGTPGNDIQPFSYSRLYGAGGNDELSIAVAGRGEVHGGSGDDIVYVNPYTSGAFGTVRGGGGDDTCSGAALDDKVAGAAGDDVLAGRAGGDRLFGGAGSDLVRGEGGRDVLYGGGSSDKGAILAPGTSNASGPPDYGTFKAGLFGGAGDDRVYGGKGRDALDGGVGDDLLAGGAGQDRMTGGGGRDTFRFKLGDSLPGGSRQDTILDFRHGDRIDLAPIDARAGKHGNQAFDYIGHHGFGGKAGQLRYDGGVVKGDVDGDGRADFAVKVKDAPHLGDADFLL